MKPKLSKEFHGKTYGIYLSPEGGKALHILKKKWRLPGISQTADKAFRLVMEAETAEPKHEETEL